MRVRDTRHRACTTRAPGRSCTVRKTRARWLRGERTAALSHGACDIHGGGVAPQTLLLYCRRTAVRKFHRTTLGVVITPIVGRTLSSSHVSCSSLVEGLAAWITLLQRAWTRCKKSRPRQCVCGRGACAHAHAPRAEPAAAAASTRQHVTPSKAWIATLSSVAIQAAAAPPLLPGVRASSGSCWRPSRRPSPLTTLS